MPDLVGREAELHALDRMLSAVQDGAPRFAALVGEPGIGKTRMLDAARTAAESHGWLVLSGRAAQFELETPYEAFIDALDDYLGSINPRLFEPLGGRTLAELATIFPAISESAGAATLALDAERYRAFRGVRSLLELFGRRKPVLLGLDDLHWSDGATQELLAFLLRRPPRGPVLTCLAYREGQVPSRLRDALLAADREGLVERLKLGPLTRAETAALIGAAEHDDAVAALHRETGGNPFYAEELWRHGGVRREVTGDTPGAGLSGVPDAVAAALNQELTGLDRDSRLLLDGAAVAGDAFDPDLAAAGAGLSASTALDRLDALLERGIVRTGASPREFRFRHPIVRRAAFEAVSPGWRLAAHRRIASLLAGRRASVLVRAHHVEQAAQPGDEEAIALLIEAGSAAAARAPASSAHWLGAALRLLPADASARRLELLVPFSTALGTAGELERACDGLTEVLALLPEADTVMRARMSAYLAAIENLLGRHDVAHARLRQALDRVAPDSSEAAALSVQLSVDAVYESDWDAQYEWAGTARAAARAAGDDELAATGEALLAYAATSQGRIDVAEGHRREAEPLLEAQLAANSIAALEGLFFLAFGCYFMERWREGANHFSRALEHSRSLGIGQWVPQLHTGAALCLASLGELDAARAHADEAEDGARLTRNPHGLAWAHAGGFTCAAAAGDRPAALRLGEEALATIGELPSTHIGAAMRCYFAWACAELGEFERCVEEMLAGGSPDFERATPDQRCRWAATLATAHLALGEREPAARWVRRGERLAKGLKLPVAEAWNLRARALLLLDSGRNQEACACALQAAERQTERGARVEAARSAAVAGRALAASGERAAAIERLTSAHATLDECGALRFRDEVSRELRQLGISPSRASARPANNRAEALSRREREVAELVAEGRTNREIARSLFVSEKTVEKHVSGIFRKLGVGRRAAVAAKLD